MSTSYLNSQIASIDRDIHSYQQQINSLDYSIHLKQKDTHRIMEKIQREKDLKRLIDHNKELTRKNEEIARLEKDKLNKAKQLADKQNKKNDLQQQLNKEEAKEREKAKKEHQEILSLQQEISREMERTRFKSSRLVSDLKPIKISKQYHVFISHAFEDKEFVRPFANALITEGLNVWYDEFELKLGDSLRRSIDNGLKNSKYGIVVLSEYFFNKEWPQKELDGLFAKETNGEKVILPLWHKISKNEVLNYSPIIADMLALNTSNFTIEELAKKIAEQVLEKE